MEKFRNREVLGFSSMKYLIMILIHLHWLIRSLTAIRDIFQFKLLLELGRCICILYSKKFKKKKRSLELFNSMWTHHPLLILSDLIMLNLRFQEPVPFCLWRHLSPLRSSRPWGAKLKMTQFLIFPHQTQIDSNSWVALIRLTMVTHQSN